VQIEPTGERGFSTGPSLPSGFLPGFKVASAEPFVEEELPFVDENFELLAALLGDGDIDESNVLVDDSDFGSVFESWVNEDEEQSVTSNGVVKPLELHQPPCSIQEQDEPCLTKVEHVSVSPVKPEVFKSTSTKQALFRQNAIDRWMRKRERRVFVRRVARQNAADRNNRSVPNRSGSNGRFVKSTCGFISITEAQSRSTLYEDDHSCDMLDAN